LRGKEMAYSKIFIAEDALTRKLKLYLRNNRNVLFIGKHGTGKSTVVKNLWDSEGLSYRIFSAATMDPWVDFIGCPEKKLDEESGETYLNLVRPKEFQDDAVEALFFDEFNRCLTGDTKISLADGSAKCIRDLVGVSHFYVYSYDIKNKKVEIGKAHSARITQKNQKILKITLDNGLFVRCTVDHPFLTKDGKYKNAGDLIIGDSLMPLYRKKSNRIKKNKYTMSGYEETYQPELNTWEYTHILSDRYNLRNDVYSESKGSVRHHKDFNKLNNSPENIEKVFWSKHALMHKETASKGGKACHILHPDLYDRTINTSYSRKKTLENSIFTRRNSKTYKVLRSNTSKRYFDEQKKREQVDRCRSGWKNGQFNFDQKAAHQKRFSTIAINFAKEILLKFGSLTKELYNTERQKVRGSGKSPVTLEKIKSYFASFNKFKSCVMSQQSCNHKIISIEFDGYEDVYDITVDEFHNFALDAGVFVHNSHKKIRNAVMELIQFKSINGREFKNLRIIWAAINPEKDEIQEYDVEALDPAQKDRFHIHIYMPYKPNKAYFVFKFGAEIAEAACSWWEALKKETSKNPEIINQVSPRRLDYAIEVHLENGSLDDVLPKSTNPSKLRELLKQIPTISKLNELLAAKDRDKAKEFLDDENNLADVTHEIIKSPAMIDFFIPLLPPERRNSLISKETVVSIWALRNYQNYPAIHESLKQIADAGTNRVLTSQILKKFEKDKVQKIGNLSDNPEVNKKGSVSLYYVVEKRSDKIFPDLLTKAKKTELVNTYHRNNTYIDICDKIPKIMTDTNAKKCLGILNDIINLSHRKTLSKCLKLLKLPIPVYIIFMKTKNTSSVSSRKISQMF